MVMFELSPIFTVIGRTHMTGKKNSIYRWTWGRRILVGVTLVVALGALFGFLSTPEMARAAVPAGFSEYYIPGFSDDLMQMLDAIDSYDIGTTLTNITTVSVGGDVTLYYDHWENGFLNGANGDESYTASKGAVLTFRSTNIPYPRGASLTACSGSTYPTGGVGGAPNHCYDGRDRIYVSGSAVSVAQAFWPTTSNTNFANAWEIYPIKPYQTSYIIPVGENLYGTGSFADFQGVFVMVQATADNTNIQINDPGTLANPDVNVTLARGQTVHLDHIDAGTTVNASNPVQVQFLIGNDTHYNSRSYTAVPNSLWSTEYYAPVPSTPGGWDTDLFIYNPTGATLTINYEDQLGSGSFNIAAYATESYSQNTGRYTPANSAVYLAAADGATEFWAIGGADAGSQVYNWGFTLLPPDTLTQEYFISWAPGGWDQATGGASNASYSPAYVTPVEDNTTVFVDYSPADGTVDATYVLNRLEVQKIYDTGDADNTGMHIWATHPIAVTWGEDPTSSPQASPGLDAGYTILPLNQSWIDVVLLMEKTAHPVAIPDEAGQTSEFTLTVSTDTVAVDGIDVEDLLPANWQFVDDSATITFPGGSQITGNAADPSITGQTLSWPLNASLATGQNLTITFTGITTAAPGQASVNWAEASGVFNGQTFTAAASASVEIAALRITKTSNASGLVHPGDTIEYTLTIDNIGSATQTGIAISDLLPEGVTLVPGSAWVTGYKDTAGYYLDTFDSRDYAGNDGTLNWAANWVEYNEGDGARSGDEQVMTDASNYQLRVQDNDNGGEGVTRAIGDLSWGDTARLSFSYRRFIPGLSTEYVSIYLYNGTWNEIARLGPGSDTTYQSFQYDLLTSYITPDVRIGLITSGANGGSEGVWFDNVRLDVNGLLGGSWAAGDFSNLTTAVDGYGLKAGQSMTVTYLVTVDDPNAFASFENTASVTSNELTDPQSAAIAHRLATFIGDLIWFDVDGDGVYDIGEPGIPNVEIELYNPGSDGIPGGGDDTWIASTRSDANGRYQFANQPAGHYYAQVNTGSLPAGITTTAAGITNPHGAFTALASGYLQADFGFTQASGAGIGDTIWSDADNDSVLDAGEPGLGGVALALVSDPGPDGLFGSSDDGVIATTTSDASGHYNFTNLPAGDYRVVANVGADGIPGSGDEGLAGYTVSSGPQSPGANVSLPVSLGENDVFVDADFGYFNAALHSLSDRVWSDSDGDGSVDAGESGIVGVTVNLLNASGQVIATTVTNASGDFSFPGLPDGSYTLQISDTFGALKALTGTTTDATNKQRSVTLAGSNLSGAHFGYNRPGSLGDRVWSDANGNGTQDPGEAGLGGVTVQLYDAAGTTLLRATSTHEDGSYLFTGLTAATYQVRVTTPGGFSQTGDPDGTLNNQTSVTLPANGSHLSADFGYRNAALHNIGDTIWEDSNGNGVQNAGESGITGVTLALYADDDGDGLLDPNEALIATTTSDAAGHYSFSGLADGDYLVAVTDRYGLLQGYEITSGLDQTPLTLAGADLNTIDFGYTREIESAILGDALWYDTDGDGQFETTERGIANVLVHLYRDANQDGLAETLVASATTDFAGYYRFETLPAGVYQVQVDSSNFNAGNPLAGQLSTSGGESSSLMALSAGEINLQADFGYRAGGFSLGDFIWSDADNDGFQDAGEAGLAGVVVELLNPAFQVVATTTTGPAGNYLFAGLSEGEYRVRVATNNFAPGALLEGFAPTGGPLTQSVGGNTSDAITLNAASPTRVDVDFGYYKASGLGSIGDTVYLDKDLNGAQDSGEPGLANVSVDLYRDSNGNGSLDAGEAAIASALTDANGHYSFQGLKLNDGDGDYDYIVQVSDRFSVLAGMDATNANPRAVALSNATPTRADIDFGFDDPTLGDRVWHDANQNGIQDAGESGLAGVTVLLYVDVDGDGVLDAGFDNLLRRTVTQSDGSYYFGGLPFRSFILKVADGNFAGDGVLLGFSAAPQNLGGDEALDSDADPSSHQISITPLSAKDYTLDFGFYASSGHAIGDLIWLDTDRDGYKDGSEAGIAGVSVDLYRDGNGNGAIDANEARIGRVISNSAGAYRFENVPSGNYVVYVSDVYGRLTDFVWVNGNHPGQNNYSQPPTYAVSVSSADVLYADSGYYQRFYYPTAVTLAGFEAEASFGRIRVSWNTAFELEALSFNLYRSTSPEAGESTLLNAQPILSHATGGAYEYIDMAVEAGVTYYYWLEVTDSDGTVSHGPVSATGQFGVFLPVTIKQ